MKEATNLASLVGLHGLTIGALAGHTGMSRSGLFRHFGSKEQLQVETLRAAVDRFVAAVVRPALKAPRGVARLRAPFDHWLRWGMNQELDGGCLFVAASIELDDRPGPPREFLIQHQTMWLDLIAETARRAMGIGELRPDLDPAQFAYEFNAILLGFHQTHRLLRDPDAAGKATRMFDRLIAQALAGAPVREGGR